MSKILGDLRVSPAPCGHSVEPNGSQLEAQLLRIISEAALSEEQLTRISELLHTLHEAGR